MVATQAAGFEEKTVQAQVLKRISRALARDLLVLLFAMRGNGPILPTISNLSGIIAALALLIGGRVKSFADPSTNVILDPCLTLAALVSTNGQIQLTLNCESGITYVLQSSADLQHWDSILTNNDPSVVRTFNPAATDTVSFYRLSREPLPLFAYAFATRNAIDLNGNGLTTDSYNSADTNFSTRGRYDPVKATTNGNIASLIGPVFLGNHSIGGSLFLGPGASYASSSGQVYGSILQNFNTCFPDVVAPDFSTWPPAPIVNTNIDGMTYEYAFFQRTGDYIITNSVDSIYVGPNANVRLIVTAPGCNLGSVQIAGQTNQSGKLTVYQLAGTAYLHSGNVENGNAANCAYWGLPGVTNITLGGTTPFTGTIYAPSANLSASGGGLQPFDFCGSCIVKALVVNSHYMFHFDESLLKAGPKR